MSNCSKHKKEVAGIDDMKILAEMVADLNYQSLTKLLGYLSEKIAKDSIKDAINNRVKLARELYAISYNLSLATQHSNIAWHISKPFMTEKSIK